MRNLNCMQCAQAFRDRHPDVKANGKPVLLYPESAEGRAEYGRLVVGKLKMDGWVCDGCNLKLRAGDRAACVSAWIAGREVRVWEYGYLNVEEAA